MGINRDKTAPRARTRKPNQRWVRESTQMFGECQFVARAHTHCQYNPLRLFRSLLEQDFTVKDPPAPGSASISYQPSRGLPGDMSGGGLVGGKNRSPERSKPGIACSGRFAPIAEQAGNSPTRIRKVPSVVWNAAAGLGLPLGSLVHRKLGHVPPAGGFRSKTAKTSNSDAPVHVDADRKKKTRNPCRVSIQNNLVTNVCETPVRLPPQGSKTNAKIRDEA